jgi:hypothetical protein
MNQVMPAAMAPGMYGAASAYRKDFGEECSDPMERAAPSERFQSRMTTGRDLAAGSTRATNNPPGYTGHIAASKYVWGHLHVAASIIKGDAQVTLAVLQNWEPTRQWPAEKQVDEASPESPGIPLESGALQLLHGTEHCYSTLCVALLTPQLRRAEVEITSRMLRLYIACVQVQCPCTSTEPCP